MQAIAIHFHNPTTGKEYSGGNIQRLQDCADSNPAFVSGAFATFRQWLSVGRCVVKGQKAACRLIACKSDALVGVAENGKPTGEATIARGFVKGFAVFALEQTAPLDAEVANAALDEIEAPAPKEDKPEPGKLYSLATLAKEGTWKAAEIEEDADLRLARHHGDRLAEKAQRLERDAKACLADRLTNTPKRMAQAMGKRLEGQRAQRTAQILLAVVEKCKTDPACIYARIPAGDIIKHAIAAARFRTMQVANGHHSYLIETSEPEDNGQVLAGYRELLDPRKQQAAQEESQRILAENELRNCDFPGFFPTPSAVIAVMLEQVGDLTGKTVLEPSAGKGDLVQAAFRAGARTVKSFEIVPKLASYLVKHVQVPRLPCVHVSQNADFMEQMPICADARVDVVLMNPPFEKDAAPKHVLHALSWLKPGGKLVSVMPANWQEKASADHLLRMIDDMGLSMMDMEVEGAAFNGHDAFRQTAVRTSILVIG